MNERRLWLHQLPKVELHLHLEGAIPLEALWSLIRKYGGDRDVPDQSALTERFKYRDFRQFISTWVWKNQFLRDYEDFSFISEAVARDLARQNIRYAETFISPPDFVRYGLETGRIIQAVRAGLEKVPEIKINLIVDLVRDYGEARGAETLEAVMNAREFGVVGIGIGGSEKEYPPKIFKAVYEMARKAGFKTSAHAGEAAGPESVWEAIRELQVDRIGHATCAGSDAALADFLVTRRIPLEMCPLSNLRTQVIPAFKDHPIRWFFDHGALVTVNTDDPKMFNNSLVDEFDLLMTEHHFSPGEIKKLILNSVEASWLPTDEKTRLARSFTTDKSWEAAGP